MARETAEEGETAKGAISSRVVTGTMAMRGDCVARTDAAVEQTGQMCEADGVDVKSVQKWSCAPKKMTPRNNARMHMRLVLACMCLLRRSLGRNGCRVKHGPLSAGYRWGNPYSPFARRDTQNEALFPGEIGFGLGEFRSIGGCAADFRQLGVKRLRIACVASCLGGTSGTEKTVKAGA